MRPSGDVRVTYDFTGAQPVDHFIHVREEDGWEYEMQRYNRAQPYPPYFGFFRTGRRRRPAVTIPAGEWEEYDR